MTDALSFGWLTLVIVGLLAGTLPFLIVWAARANSRAFGERYPDKARETPSVVRGTAVLLALMLAWVFALVLAPGGKALILAGGIAGAEAMLLFGIARARRRAKD